MNDSYYLIPHITVFLLAVGFIWFILKTSPELRKMIKRSKKLRRKQARIREASKARDYQI